MNAPDLQDTSDTGLSNTDDITSDNTPDIDIECSESESIIELFVDTVSQGTSSCTNAGDIATYRLTA